MRRPTGILTTIVALAAVLLGGVWVLRPARSAPISASLSVAEALGSDTTGFARVTEPRPFSFPADHGPHPDYKTEWWYYTGNLEAADGRHFGYQLTFFRNGVTPDPAQRKSEWATHNIYMAHFAFTDVAGAQFFADERFSRDGADLAGAQAEPFRVWTESWAAEGDPDTGTRLRAEQDGVALDLTVRSDKPPVLQGDAGFSRKDDAPGSASYYYSLTRMPTTGTVTVDGQRFEVTGLSWKDREWSTSVLGADQVGWDWFALQLDDGDDLMYYQIRLSDGGVEPLSSGKIVAPDGSATPISRDEVAIEVLDTWTSPRTGAVYPSRWRLRVPARDIDLTVEPYLADQELPISVVYWEGAVKVSGTHKGSAVAGDGYIEMTGYGEPERQEAPNRTR